MEQPSSRPDLLSRLPLALKQIASSASLARLGEFIYVFAEELGFQAVAGGMLTGPKATSSNLFYFNNWPESWFALYRERGVAVDPAVRWALTSGVPITWTDLAARLDHTDPGHEMMRVAAEYGYSEGFVLPVRTPSGHLGLVCLGGCRGRVSADEQSLLQSIGTAALNQAEALAGHGARAGIPPALTKRERDCVVLLVKGRSEREIGAELGISPATARFHLDNARSKLGASSRAQLAVLATGLMQNL